MLHDFLNSNVGEYILVNNKFFGRIQAATPVLLTVKLGEVTVHKENDYGDKTFYISTDAAAGYFVVDKIETFYFVDTNDVEILSGEK